jgi:hypothetical protein
MVPRSVLERMTRDWRLAYRDPLAALRTGRAYEGTWLAAAQPVGLHRAAGLTVVVQERSRGVTGPVEDLGRRLLGEGLLALAAVAVAVPVLWFLALGRREAKRAREAPSAGPPALRDRSTGPESAGPG